MALVLARNWLKEMSKEIEKLIAAENWKDARKLIRAALRKEPDSHWLLTRLGATYYEEFNYEKALFHSGQALELAPNCPLVLWDYAGALDMLGRTKEAIAIYKKLVKRGVEAIAYDDCGEGLAWARGLVADCLYRLAQCYDDAGRYKDSLDYYYQHIRLRGPGCRSIYSIGEVREWRRQTVGKILSEFGPKYRLAKEQQRRVEELLPRSNAGHLNRAERHELDALLRMGEEIMLRRARAMDHI